MSLLVGILIGVALAIGVLQFGALIVGPLAEAALAIVSTALVATAVAAILFYIFRRTLFARLKLKVDARIEDLKTPAATFADAVIARDAPRAIGSAIELGSLGLAWQAQVRSRRAIVAGLTALLALFAAILGSALLVKQNELLAKQNDLVVTQNQLVEAQRRASLVFELGNVLDQVKEERLEFEKYLRSKQETPRDWYDKNYRRTQSALAVFGPTSEQLPLSEGLIGRVVALSLSLRPYQYLETEDASASAQDSQAVPKSPRQSDTSAVRLSRKAQSPERGQLLLSLLSSNVDIQAVLRSGADFRFADMSSMRLFKAQLSKIDLSAIDARGAQIRTCEMTEAQLLDADLRGANLSATNLHAARLQGADLRGADLSGADLSHAFLGRARLPTAELLRDAKMAWTSLEGALVPAENWLAEVRDQSDANSKLDISLWQVHKVSQDVWTIVKRQPSR